MDKKDEKILEILKENAKLPTLEISKKTGIPATTVHNRIKKMEKEGIIEGYKALVNYKKIGKDITAFLSIVVQYFLPSGEKILQEDLAKRIKTFPQVEEVYILTGATDILLKIVVRNSDELNDFVVRKLRTLNGVDKVQTAVVLEEIK